MTYRLIEGRGVFLGWVAANYLGLAAAAALTITLPFLARLPGMLVSSLMIGIPIGFAQWIALRRLAPLSILWVITISAGLPLGLVVNPILAGNLWGFLDDESVLALAAAFTTIGVMVGLLQWLFLRVHFSRSLVWVLSSGAGLGLGTGIVLAADLVNRSGFVSIFLVALVYAAATGSVLLRLPAWQRKAFANPTRTA